MTLPPGAVTFNDMVVGSDVETRERVQLQDGSNGISA